MEMGYLSIFIIDKNFYFLEGISGIMSNMYFENYRGGVYY